METKIQRSNRFFVATRIYEDIISTLENHNVVLVVGNTGIGKSATCVGVLEYYRDRLEWKTKHLPTDTVEKLEEKTILLVDITFGDISLYSRYDPNIEKMLIRLYTSQHDCREFKVLITSSRSFPLTSETNIPILKGCAKFNFGDIQYEKDDLKKLYEKYTKRSSNIENETGLKSNSREQTTDSVMSNHDVQQNNVYKEHLELEEDKDISTDCRTDKRNSRQNLSDDTLKKANISEFGLPAVCYLHRDFQEDVENSKTIDVMPYLDSYVLSLAESNNKWERQRYSTLVYMMLNGSIISSGSILKQLLGEIDPTLDPERLLVCATEMVDEGLLQKRGKDKDGKMKASENVFSFSNDILLFVVIKSYATRNIQMFLRYSYLPFIMQFLLPKEQPDYLSIQPRVDADFLLEIGKGRAKRITRKENELKGLTFLEEFERRLNVHEVATEMSWKIDKEKMDGKRGNIFVRKMINHHPYLKEYYEYAEPEKFQSIPKDGFKSDVKGHPSCRQSRTPDDF